MPAIQLDDFLKVSELKHPIQHGSMTAQCLAPAETCPALIQSSSSQRNFFSRDEIFQPQKKFATINTSNTLTVPKNLLKTISNNDLQSRNNH